MKTISAKRSLIESFKRAQLLPVLTATAVPARPASEIKSADSPTVSQTVTPLGYVPSLPLTRANHPNSASAAPIALALGAAVCLAQAVALTLSRAENSHSMAAPVNGWVS
jgi:hypothetical protein